MMSKNNIQSIVKNNNLLKNEDFKAFLNLQKTYGVAQSGGISLYNNRNNHQNRIVSDVNLLDSPEIRGIIFENFIALN